MCSPPQEYDGKARAADMEADLKDMEDAFATLRAFFTVQASNKAKRAVNMEQAMDQANNEDARAALRDAEARVALRDVRARVKAVAIAHDITTVSGALEHLVRSKSWYENRDREKLQRKKTLNTMKHRRKRERRIAEQKHAKSKEREEATGQKRVKGGAQGGKLSR